MKKSRFTEEQIAFVLKQAETGTKIDEFCRKMGISDANFYKFKQKYSFLWPSELRKLKQLAEENSKLKLIERNKATHDTGLFFNPWHVSRRPVKAFDLWQDQSFVSFLVCQIGRE